MKQVFTSLLRNSHSRKGFTLIELLVVIAIIGILAVAVLAAINPIEQLNKSRDTGLNADAKQLLDATERYYTNSNPAVYPWNVDNTASGYSANDINPNTSFLLDSRTSNGWGWLANLTDAQELKDTFVNRMKTSKSFIVFRAPGANVSTYVCYFPTSNTMRRNADKYCATNGNTVNDDATRAGMPANSICATTTGTAPSVPGTNANCLP